MSRKMETMTLKGNQYAKVATRTKEFWEKYPHGKIATTHEDLENGTTKFKAYIWKDKAEFIELLKNGATTDIAMLSADAEGTAQAASNKVQAEKGFEKLETVAVGRALGLLGFLASGEIASDEEMLAFEEFKEEKAAEARETAINTLAKAKTMEELKTIFSTLPRDLWTNKEVIAKKDEMKIKLTEKAKKEEAKNENS